MKGCLMRRGLILAAVLTMPSCSPGPGAYTDAMHAEWETERQIFADRASFKDNFAKGFEASAEQARGVAQRLGTRDMIGPDHLATAQRAREEANSARYSANSVFQRVSEAHCVSAGNMPGQNCEISFVVRGPDGKEDVREGSYRLDKRDGKIVVVGPASGQ